MPGEQGFDVAPVVILLHCLPEAVWTGTRCAQAPHPRRAAESALPAWCAGQAADAQQPLSAPQQQYLRAARQARQHQVAGTQSQFPAVDAFLQACPEEPNGKRCQLHAWGPLCPSCDLRVASTYASPQGHACQSQLQPLIQLTGTAAFLQPVFCRPCEAPASMLGLFFTQQGSSLHFGLCPGASFHGQK